MNLEHCVGCTCRRNPLYYQNQALPDHQEIETGEYMWIYSNHLDILYPRIVPEYPRSQLWEKVVGRPALPSPPWPDSSRNLSLQSCWQILSSQTQPEERQFRIVKSAGRYSCLVLCVGAGIQTSRSLLESPLLHEGERLVQVNVLPDVLAATLRDVGDLCPGELTSDLLTQSLQDTVSEMICRRPLTRGVCSIQAMVLNHLGIILSSNWV